MWQGTGTQKRDDPGLAEDCESFVSLCKQQNSPKKRDWNGSGAHSQVTAAAWKSVLIFDFFLDTLLASAGVLAVTFAPSVQP